MCFVRGENYIIVNEKCANVGHFYTLQRLMTFLVVAVSVFRIASCAAETRAFLYPTALSGLIAAFKHRYNCEIEENRQFNPTTILDIVHTRITVA